MFLYEEENMLFDDREDLIALLQMRFGKLSGELIEKIYEIKEMNTLQRLILLAANAADWPVFLEEFYAVKDSFQLADETFTPLIDWLKGRDGIDGKEKAK